jgi:4-amino-4-deoxy-L-arabinose transferase-like glycosyltransferase
MSLLVFLPITLIGTATVLLTFLIGKTLADERIGLFAGFILSTMSGFFPVHRHCRVDPMLLFCVTLSLYGLAAGFRDSEKNGLSAGIFYLGMAGAFLSKGIIGMAIPLGVAAVFLVTTKGFTGLRRFALTPGILLFLIPVFLWAYGVWYSEGTGILREVVRQSLWRFLSPSADHAKPVYFYVIPVFQVLLPWTLFPCALLWFRGDRIRSVRGFSLGSLIHFSVIWFLIVFIGLSVSSSKRALYLAPAFPALALLAALGWEHIREILPRAKRGERYGLILVFLVYAGMHLLFVIPAENRASLRPVFETVLRQPAQSPVFLVNPSETTLGASFFYLGKKIPVLTPEESALKKFENRSGTFLVTEGSSKGSRLDSDLRSKGFRLLLQQKASRKNNVVYLYSNGP